MGGPPRRSCRVCRRLQTNQRSTLEMSCDVSTAPITALRSGAPPSDRGVVTQITTALASNDARVGRSAEATALHVDDVVIG